MTPKSTALTALLVLFTALAAPPASAETVGAVCRADWWTGSTTTNASMGGLTALPTVPLPAVWSENWTNVAPDPTTTPELKVVIRDGASNEVAGTLGVGLNLGAAATAYDGATSRRLARTLWWRPTADLAPGNYTASITAGVPALTSDNAECYFQGFAATLSFTVVAEPPPAPTMTAKVTLERVYSDTLVYQSGAACASNPNATTCANGTTACCAWSLPPEVTLTNEVKVSGLGSPNAYQYALFIEHDSVLHELVGQTPWDHELVHPVANETPVVNTMTYRPAPQERPFPNGSFCVDATLLDLTIGIYVATVQNCASASDLDAVKSTPDVCAPSACAATNPAPPEPGPEPAPDANPEPSPDTTADPAPDSAVIPDADALPFDATPAGSKQSSGCGTTPASDTLPALFALLAALALATRRRQHHFCRQT